MYVLPHACCATEQLPSFSFRALRNPIRDIQQLCSTSQLSQVLRSRTENAPATLPPCFTSVSSRNASNEAGKERSSEYHNRQRLVVGNPSIWLLPFVPVMCQLPQSVPHTLAQIFGQSHIFVTAACCYLGAWRDDPFDFLVFLLSITWRIETPREAKSFQGMNIWLSIQGNPFLPGTIDQLGRNSCEYVPSSARIIAGVAQCEGDTFTT